MIESYEHGPGCSDYRNHPACWVFSPYHKFKQMPYDYVKQSDIQPYWTMASRYTLADHTFASNSGPTFVAHQYLIAGQSGHTSEVPTGTPWGCDAPPSVSIEKLVYGTAHPPVFSKATGHEVGGPYPCFNYKTVANLLDAAGVSWRYYTPNLYAGTNGFEAIKPVRDGPDWQNMSINTNVLTDAKNGTLAHVSWVTPQASYSDHAGPSGGKGGPDWVASVVNAIGESKYWKNSAIIIMWDDWGGWYDHVNPPQYADPVTGAYEGLGFRIPCIIVSPYAKAHYISHQQHEVASSLHFIERTFGLGSLGLADARADAFDDAFNFSKKPMKFQPIPTVLKAEYFLRHQSTLPADPY